MDHGLMMGMLVGGILLSIFPLALSVALCVVGIRLYRAERAEAQSSSRKRARLRR